MPLFFRSLLLALVALLSAQVRATPITTACTANTAYQNKVRLNEAKSQGGGTGFDFIEIFITGNNVQIDGWKIGLYNCNGSGCPGPKYILLGQSNGCVNNSDSSCTASAKDYAGRTYNYPTYVTYELPNMDQHNGQFILIAPDGNLADYITYSDTSTCPALYWAAPPAGTCLNTSPCASNFNPSNADLQRTEDGSGDWTPRTATTTGGTNAGSSPNPPPSGAQGYKFSFSPSSANFCIGSPGTVTVKAVWVDSNGTPLSPEQINTTYTGTSFSWSVTGSATVNAASWASGQVELTVANASGSVGLTAANTELPGTASSSGTYQFDSCPSSPAAFNAVDSGENAVSGKIKTKIAGTAFNLDLAVINSAGNGVDTAFAGDVKVELLGNNTLNVSLDSQNCPTTSSSLIAPFTTTFVAATHQGRKSVAFPTVADSWRDVRVKLSYPATGTATTVGCSIDNFALRPHLFSASASDQDWQTAWTTGTARTLYNTSANGGNVHKAGQPFTLQARAMNSANAVTANYSGTPSTSMASCSSGSACTGTLGTLTPGTWNVASGIATTSTAIYSEVGAFSLDLQDQTFALVDAGDGTSADCSGQYICSSTFDVGRFVPDHFTLTPGTVTAACGTFTYFGQDGLTTTFTLTAENAANIATGNYTGALARLNLADWNSFAFSAATLPSGATLAASATAPSGTWNNGQASNLTAKHRISRPTAATGETALVVSAQPADADGVTAAGATAVHAGTTPLRYGRARLLNVNGSELLDLPMPFKAEYWAGTASGWQLNSADTCTTATIMIADGTLAASKTCVWDTPADNYSGAACSATPAIATRKFLEGGVSGTDSDGVAGFAGKFNLWLRAPGNGNIGYVTLTGVVPAHLQYNWSGSVGNPSARATFGVQKSGPVIYRREIVGR